MICKQVGNIFGFPPLNQGFRFKRSKTPTNHFVANAKSGAASAVAKQSTTSSSSSVTSSTTENRKSKKFLNKWREKASMSKFGKGTKSLVMSCISIYYQIVVVIGTEVVLKKSSWWIGCWRFIPKKKLLFLFQISVANSDNIMAK